jgi:hypothetical protein
MENSHTPNALIISLLTSSATDGVLYCYRKNGDRYSKEVVFSSLLPFSSLTRKTIAFDFTNVVGFATEGTVFAGALDTNIFVLSEGFLTSSSIVLQGKIIGAIGGTGNMEFCEYPPLGNVNNYYKVKSYLQLPATANTVGTASLGAYGHYSFAAKSFYTNITSPAGSSKITISLIWYSGVETTIYIETFTIAASTAYTVALSPAFFNSVVTGTLISCSVPGMENILTSSYRITLTFDVGTATPSSSYYFPDKIAI